MSSGDPYDLDFTHLAPGRPLANGAAVVIAQGDADTRRLLEAALSGRGFAVRAAADSREFLQHMRVRPMPRLVLLDVELPRVSGLRILLSLREHPQTSSIPVIMVMSQPGSHDAAQALALGADGYVPRPVAIDALHSVVDTVLRKAA